MPLSLQELIDTLWNVNVSAEQLLMIIELGINRYIMECKSSLLSFRYDVVLELIDTLWNVNVLVRTSVLYDIF